MEKTSINSGNKWLLGIGDSVSPVEIGHFTEVIDRPHKHEKTHEYYMIIQGSMRLFVNGIENVLKKGDVVYIEPGEIHHAEPITKEIEGYLVKWPHLQEDKIYV